jgi:hypothetical protein
VAEATSARAGVAAKKAAKAAAANTKRIDFPSRSAAREPGVERSVKRFLNDHSTAVLTEFQARAFTVSSL